MGQAPSGPAPVMALKAQRPPPLHAARPASSEPLVLKSRLNAVRARLTRPVIITVRSGDTLSKISGREWGSPSLWPDLWWANRKTVPDPDMLAVPHLLLPRTHPAPGWRLKRAEAAIPVPVPPPPAGTSGAAPVSSVPVTPDSAFEACVIRVESGGNAQIMNSSEHYGLFQFSLATWEAYGGDPALFGHASAAYQEQIFANAMATPGGNMNWSPYDGCWPGTQAAGAHLMTSPLTKRHRAFSWAIANIRGCWYVYGGTGPCSRGYDCSGAVQRAYAAVGIFLPRTAAEIQSSRKVYRISPGQARKGDIVAWGWPAFHVELVAYKWRYTFGEHVPGTRAATVRTWGAPHEFLRVRHSG
jgi:hypothetical protein